MSNDRPWACLPDSKSVNRGDWFGRAQGCRRRRDARSPGCSHRSPRPDGGTPICARGAPSLRERRSRGCVYAHVHLGVRRCSAACCDWTDRASTIAPSQSVATPAVADTGTKLYRTRYSPARSGWQHRWHQRPSAVASRRRPNRQRVSDLPLVPEGVHDAADQPSVLGTHGGRQLSASSDGARGHDAGISDDQQRTAGRAANDKRIEAPSAGVRHPEPRLTNRKLGNEVVLVTDAVEDRRVERLSVEVERCGRIADPQLGLHAGHSESLPATRATRATPRPARSPMSRRSMTRPTGIILCDAWTARSFCARPSWDRPRPQGW